MRKTRKISTLLITSVIVAACGGGDSIPGEPESGSGASPTRADVDEGASPEASDELGGTATLTVDGTALRYSMDPIVYTFIEGVDDVTVERCNPDLMSTGTLHAIGYPIDENGELITAANGEIAGSLNVQVPPEDWEAQGFDSGELDFDFSSDTAEVDLKIASPEDAAEIAPDAEHSWTRIDGGITGTAVFTSVRGDPYVVEFELTCG